MPQLPHVRATLVAALVLVVLSAPAAAHAASPLTIGTGHKPGVAVDAAGTAYLAWYGDESGNTSLQFCRLPRRAAACDATQRVIPAPGGSLSRPFVSVNGSTVKVASYRYGLTGGTLGNEEVWLFTSTNGGVNFDSGRPIGVIPFDEAVNGPGDTVTAVTNAFHEGLVVQSMPLDGSPGSTARANQSAADDHPYNGTIGLIDTATPLEVSSTGSSLSQFRRYDGSGSLNDAANWTAPVDLGYADYPKLAGGPSGLFLLAGLLNNNLVVRKWNGSTFTRGVKLSDTADDAQDHLAQDAAGRLHAVFPRGAFTGIDLVHATSDDGIDWQSGTVLNQTDGGIAQLRAALAPDHIGVAAWETRIVGGATQVRVVGIGPAAPAGALPASKPPATARRLPRGRVRVTVKGTLRRPASVSRAQGCRGSLTVTLRRGLRVVATHKLAIGRRCTFGEVLVLSRAKVKGTRRFTLTVRFPGNVALGAALRNYALRVR